MISFTGMISNTRTFRAPFNLSCSLYQYSLASTELITEYKNRISSITRNLQPGDYWIEWCNYSTPVILSALEEMDWVLTEESENHDSIRTMFCEDSTVYSFKKGSYTAFLGYMPTSTKPKVSSLSFYMKCSE